MERTSADAGAIGGTPAAPWELQDVRLAQLTYEAAKSATMAVMPPDVTRPIPPYARIIAVEAGDSPVGPLRFAALFIGGRHNMMPRNVLADAIVEGDVDAMRRVYGGGWRPGSVAIERDGSQVTVSIAADEGPLGTVTLPAIHAIDPAMLRWDPWLTYAETGEGISLVEFAIEPAPTGAFLSKGATLDTPRDLPRGHRWRQLRNVNTVTSCYLEGGLRLAAPEAKGEWPA
jgi:hypothetical protein